MTFKMEGSGETQGVKDNLKVLTGEDSIAKVDDNANDVSRFARERNLLLLSALYKLYGEEWTSTPDWSKVAEEIHNAKIPVFGESFTPESCERQYKLLLEKGYQVGIADITTILKAPKRLTEAQTRVWILASTSNDLVGTSKILDEKMRAIYKTELIEIDKLPDHSDISTQELAKELEVPEDMDTGEDAGEVEEYEDPEAQEVAAEIPQYEVNEKIVGMKDVLLLVKYCHDAVENAIKKFTSLKSTKKQPSVSQESSPVKVEKTADITKSNISANQVSQELSNLVHSAIAKASEDDAPKITSPTSTAPTLSKLLELPVTAPGMPLPEIPCVKPPESSLEKQSAKYGSRGNSKERTQPESAKQDSASVIESSPKGNGEQSSIPNSSPAKSSPVLDTNGQVTEKSPSKKSDPIKEKLAVDDSVTNHKPTTEKSTSVDVTGKVANLDVLKSTPSGETEAGPADESEATTMSESTVNEVNETTDPARLESPTKGKQSGRKSASAARPVSTRTSSRLVSPEPNDQPSNEEEKSPKKPLGRQTSTSESHTPILRSRRGATPTKAGAIETEPAKSAPVSTSKLDFTEENDDETFETPRSTPESPEMKSDNESSHDTKPPKQLKVYSAKPPSPLSHVDPTLFDEFIDDEDDPELAMIDSNVHKSKSDKTSTKPFSRRGRTASSENASDAGATEDTTQSKRVIKKVGTSEDVEEGEGVGNNDEASKRLTRSSLKLHDAANDEGPEAPQTESEKAASESSFSGKEKKPRTSKTKLRLKTLQDEINRVYGEGEETPEGKRVTRARAKTTVPLPEKRNKPPSVGDSEGLSESEPNTTRATRSRSSTASSMPVLEPTTTQQPPVVSDDEEQKMFRKNALALVEKITSGETFSAFQKYLPEDPFDVLKRSLDVPSIKVNIESGKIRTLTALQCDLLHLGINVIMANPNSSEVKEIATAYYKILKTSVDEFKYNLQRSTSLQKNDNSDVESLESHDEQRSETSSKQTIGGGRRKRKRSVSETSEEVLLPENKRRVTRTSTSNAFQLSPTKPKPKTKHPISPDIVAANRVRH